MPRTALWLRVFVGLLLAVLPPILLLLAAALLTGELRYVLYGAVAFAAARVVAMLLYVRRELGGALRFDAALARAQLAYSLPFALAVVLATGQLKLHELVVSHTFDVATYAIYAVGCLQIPFIDFVASPASDVMMVRMAEALGAGRTEEARASWFDASLRATWVASSNRDCSSFTTGASSAPRPAPSAPKSMRLSPPMSCSSSLAWPLISSVRR